MTHFVFEEDILAEDIARLDRDEPGWDEQAKLAEVLSALEAGMNPDVITTIYGTALVDRAMTVRKLAQLQRP